ncbi:hypothetical protein DFA_11083 [Cavenderia fasciculata]|uniref:Uncharacterized protein n=1 Tax=Cavenderia fasciculata TaxID=261658 RepID=F4QER1_CACFS|nr:uncharacterized protein DFA_11083 [Cavenderia fasciculata]EGG13322.1 hypothetical protein DFA_11083 [Cavenderia fasciculata]|eukprot:XP_004350021.1 hypothetical protein DFA_11083 [Cavenderia fasciculata]
MLLENEVPALPLQLSVSQQQQQQLSSSPLSPSLIQRLAENGIDKCLICRQVISRSGNQLHNDYNNKSHRDSIATTTLLIEHYSKCVESTISNINSNYHDDDNNNINSISIQQHDYKHRSSNINISRDYIVDDNSSSKIQLPSSSNTTKSTNHFFNNTLLRISLIEIFKMEDCNLSIMNLLTTCKDALNWKYSVVFPRLPSISTIERYKVDNRIHLIPKRFHIVCIDNIKMWKYFKENPDGLISLYTTRLFLMSDHGQLNKGDIPDHFTHLYFGYYIDQLVDDILPLSLTHIRYEESRNFPSTTITTTNQQQSSSSTFNNNNEDILASLHTLFFSSLSLGNEIKIPPMMNQLTSLYLCVNGRRSGVDVIFKPGHTKIPPSVRRLTVESYSTSTPVILGVGSLPSDEGSLEYLRLVGNFKIIDSNALPRSIKTMCLQNVLCDVVVPDRVTRLLVVGECLRQSTFIPPSVKHLCLHVDYVSDVLPPTIETLSLKGLFRPTNIPSSVTQLYLQDIRFQLTSDILFNLQTQQNQQNNNNQNTLGIKSSLKYIGIEGRYPYSIKGILPEGIKYFDYSISDPTSHDNNNSSNSNNHMNKFGLDYNQPIPPSSLPPSVRVIKLNTTSLRSREFIPVGSIKIIDSYQEHRGHDYIFSHHKSYWYGGPYDWYQFIDKEIFHLPSNKLQFKESVKYFDAIKKERKKERKMNNNNNNNNNQQSISYLTNIPNIIILKIIEEIKDNVDILCLLLTCKKMFSQIRVQHDNYIRFKDNIRSIDQDDHLSLYAPLFDTLDCFSLRSFRNIFNNSLSNQLIVIDKRNHNSTILRLSSNVVLIDSDGSIIQNHSLVNQDTIQSVLLIPNTIPFDCIKCLPSSTKTLFIDSMYHQMNSLITQSSSSSLSSSSSSSSLIPPFLEMLVISFYKTKIPIGVLPETLKSIQLQSSKVFEGDNDNSLPRGLESLTVTWHYDKDIIPMNRLHLNRLTSLTYLHVGTVSNLVTGMLPTTLTFIRLKYAERNPPFDFFLTCKSLKSLYLVSSCDSLDNDGIVVDTLDLQALDKLETFNYNTHVTGHFNPNLKVLLPSSQSSSLVNLIIKEDLIGYHGFLPNRLIKLEISQKMLIECNSSQLAPTLKKLVLRDCKLPIPIGLIPNGVTKIIIKGRPVVKDVTLRSFPSTVKHLVIGQYDGPVDYFPESLKSLDWSRDVSDHLLQLNLPEGLEKLTWSSKNEDIFITHPPPKYPSTLKSIDYSNLVGSYNLLDFPSSLTSLSMIIHRKEIINSISIFSIFNNPNQTQPSRLPSNITKLYCRLAHYDSYESLSFRLDEIINQTNVEDFTIYFSGFRYCQFNIKRLDENNLNVLLVDNDSLFGGIITQQQLNQNQNNNNQNNNIYKPLYLHYTHANQTPHWSFTPLEKESV